MKTSFTNATTAIIALLTFAALAVPQSEAQEVKQIFVRPLKSPQDKFLTTEGRAGLGDLTTLKSASAVKKLFEKLVIKEEAEPQWESDKIAAAIAKAKKLVDKAKTNEEARALIARVDFSKEVIVLVLWETGGPPGGTLHYEVKGDGLNFFIQAPDPEYVWKLRRGDRGRALLFGANFFAIPRGVSVTIEPQERPWPTP